MTASNCDRDMAIMDMHDAGASNDDIARAMGIRPSRVASVIGYMRPSLSDRATSVPVVAKASAGLLAAIARHHPDRLPERNAA